MADWRIAVALTLAVMAGPAFASEEAEPATAQQEEQAPSADSVEGEPNEDGGTEGSQDEPLSVMDTPLDGSSVESFKAGLALLDEQATESEYRSVMSALDYLLFYDLSVRRSKKKLYAKLDGQTPRQILTQVRDRASSGKTRSKSVAPDHRDGSAKQDT